MTLEGREEADTYCHNDVETATNSLDKPCETTWVQYHVEYGYSPVWLV